MELIIIKNVKQTTIDKLVREHPELVAEVDAYITPETKEGCINLEMVSKSIYKAIKQIIG